MDAHVTLLQTRLSGGRVLRGAQEGQPSLCSLGHRAAAAAGPGAAVSAAASGCVSPAAAELLAGLCARDAGQRITPAQALYLPVLD